MHTIETPSYSHFNTPVSVFLFPLSCHSIFPFIQMGFWTELCVELMGSNSHGSFGLNESAWLAGLGTGRRDSETDGVSPHLAREAGLSL